MFAWPAQTTDTQPCSQMPARLTEMFFRCHHKGRVSVCAWGCVCAFGVERY